jgi:hypothetical protein
MKWNISCGLKNAMQGPINVIPKLKLARKETKKEGH